MKKNKGNDKSGSGEAESATAAAAMVSRRRILSRSRDDLHMSANGGEADEAGGTRGHPMRNVANYFRDEEDVWYLKEKLYRVSQAGRQAGNSHCS